MSGLCEPTKTEEKQRLELARRLTPRPRIATMSTETGVWVPDTNRPTFDPNIDVATVVFSHVQCVQTRLNLAQVSKLWRDASKEVGPDTLCAKDRCLLSSCEVQAQHSVSVNKIVPLPYVNAIKVELERKS